MIENLSAGIYDYLAVQTNTFKTAITNGLFTPSADDNTNPPYAVFNDVSPSTDRDTVNKFETQRIQIICYSNSYAGVLDLQQKLWDRFDDAEGSFSVTGYNLIEVTREAPSGLITELDKVFISTTQYKIVIQK